MVLKKIGVVAMCVMLVFMPGLPVEAGSSKVIGQLKVDENFTTSDMGWLGRPKPGFVIRWRTKTINGVIAVCGAVSYPDLQLRSESRSVLRRSYVEYQGKKILRDMTFFSRVKRQSQLGSATANCASTGVKAPRGEYDLFLGWDAGSAKG